MTENDKNTLLLDQEFECSIDPKIHPVSFLVSLSQSEVSVNGLQWKEEDSSNLPEILKDEFQQRLQDLVIMGREDNVTFPNVVIMLTVIKDRSSVEKLRTDVAFYVKKDGEQQDDAYFVEYVFVQRVAFSPKLFVLSAGTLSATTFFVKERCTPCEIVAFTEDKTSPFSGKLLRFFAFTLYNTFVINGQNFIDGAAVEFSKSSAIFDPSAPGQVDFSVALNEDEERQRLAEMSNDLGSLEGEVPQKSPELQVAIDKAAEYASAQRTVAFNVAKFRGEMEASVTTIIECSDEDAVEAFIELATRSLILRRARKAIDRCNKYKVETPNARFEIVRKEAHLLSEMLDFVSPPLKIVDRKTKELNELLDGF